MTAWRSASWLSPGRARDDRDRRLHEAALTVLDEYNATGKPFALFLRTFRIRQIYGGDDDGNGALLLEMHLQRWLRERGASLIKVADTANPIMFEDDVPALLLDDAQWLTAVKELLSCAEMVLSECEFLTPGVIAELEACIAQQRIDRTALVLPSPPFDFLGYERQVEPVLRTIHQHEIDWARPNETFAFKDLLERIAQIASTNARPAEPIPVTYGGVENGYLRLADGYATNKNSGAVFFAGMRAARVADVTGGMPARVQAMLRVARLCEQAGDEGLAITILDDADAAIAASPSTATLTASIREHRSELLARMFESLQAAGDPSALFRLANSQGSRALGRGDQSVLAQCLSWMAVASLQAGDPQSAADQASDAIMVARTVGDGFREGFANVYLGHALQSVGDDEGAAGAYAAALELLPADKRGRIHVVAMVSLAACAERLGKRDEALTLFRSAHELALAMRLTDIEPVARAGAQRLQP